MPPKLSTPEWQSALADAAPHLERFQARLDQMSTDVKLLERYLTESGFRIDTRVSIGYDEHVGWSTSNGAAWRLIHFTPVNDPEEGDGLVLTPIIETPVATRWRVCQAIPSLLRAIADTARDRTSERKENEPLTDDDIPF